MQTNYNAKKTKVFTSTISPDVFTWLDNYSKEQQRTKRDILEKAILNYQEKIKKEEIKKGFKKMSQDKDMLEIAEWGIDDYNKNVLWK